VVLYSNLDCLICRVYGGAPEWSIADGPEKTFNIGPYVVTRKLIMKSDGIFQFYVQGLGFTVLIAPRPWAGRPVAIVEVSGLGCLQSGTTENVTDFVGMLLVDLEFEGVTFKVSRVDICCDVKLNFQRVVDDLEGRRYATVARAIRYFGSPRQRTAETVYVGVGDVMLRLYDKLAEVKAKGDAGYAGLLEHRWGGTQFAVTRVEFQIRGEAIREFDFLYPVTESQVRDAWTYLTSKFFRILGEQVEHRHYSRVECAGYWDEIAAAYVGDVRRHAVTAVTDPEKLSRMAYSVYAHAFALKNPYGQEWSFKDVSTSFDEGLRGVPEQARFAETVQRWRKNNAGCCEEGSDSAWPETDGVS
jgi:hypothetical protein